MKTRRTIAALGAAGLAIGGGALALTATNSASADPNPLADHGSPISFDEARNDLLGNVDTELLAAMGRDFDLSVDEVYDRLATEAVAADIEEIASTALDGSYAGTWLTDGAEGVVVAVTDPELTDDLSGLGATVEVVDRTLSDLDAVVADLNAADAPGAVHGWYADVTANAVTIVAESEAAAKDLAGSAGVDASAVDVELSDERPETLEDIVGGDPYIIDNAARCSVGFAATHPEYGDGFFSAGHCGSVGSQITGDTGEGGAFQYSVFPGSDYSWVEAGPDWTVSPLVNQYDGDFATVTDGEEAAIGASVCRSGSTTGWHCGEIEAKDQTVNYAEGTVFGMTQTTVCAEPGDSGGAYISGGSAQGMTSGGSGNCSSGGTTFFFPLDVAAEETGAELTTGTGEADPEDPGSPTEEPTAEPSEGPSDTY